MLMYIQKTAPSLLAFAILCLANSLVVFPQRSVDSDARDLEPNQTIERKMRGKETHRYKFRLRKNEFGQIRVEQKGIDVLLKLRDSQGNVLATMDTPNGNEGPEVLSNIAPADANFALEISGFDSKATEGVYTIKLDKRGDATALDKKRIEIENVFVEGIKLRNTQGQSDKAIEKLENALGGWKELDDEYLARLTATQVNQLKRTKATRIFVAARKIANAPGKTTTQYYSQKQEALSKFKEALQIYRETGNKLEESHCLSWLGVLSQNLGKNRDAQDYYKQALPLYKSAKNKAQEAKISYFLGQTYFNLRQKSEALDYFNQALQFYESTGNKTEKAIVLFNIGEAYFNLSLRPGDINLSLKEKDKALAYYDRSIPLLESSGDIRLRVTMLAGALTNAAFLYSRKGDPNQALNYYLRALPLKRSIKDRKGEEEILVGIGSIYASLGEDRKALDYLHQTIPLYRAANNEGREALMLLDLGRGYSYLGEPQKTLDYTLQALQLGFSLRGQVYDTVELSAFTNLMAYWESKGMKRLAIFFGKQAITKTRPLQGSQGNNYIVQKVAQAIFKLPYRKLAEIFMEEGEYEQAVQVLSFFQDEQFYDFDRNSRTPLQKVRFTQREVEYSRRYYDTRTKVKSLRSKIKTLSFRIGDREPNQVESGQTRKLESELKIATDRFLTVLNDGKSELALAPDEKDKVSPIKQVANVKSTLGKLSVSTKQKTAALYTLIGERNFHIVLLTSDREIIHFESPMKSEALKKKISNFYALLQSPTYDPRPIGKELYDVIVKPVEAELKKQNIKTLVWRLDENLRYIPMAALFDGKKYLAEKFQNVIFSRDDTARILKEVKPNWTGTGFGSSQARTVNLDGGDEKIIFSALPGVTEELNSIFQNDEKPILSGEVISDKRFTKKTFYAAMKKRPAVVHISSHFLFRPGDDSRSFLLLGDGNILTLREIKKQTKLFEGVELLTLSACETAATRSNANGVEIDGFAELAQRLGANAVMATLWQVSDASTPWLMREFYANREKNLGMTKTEALQKAQLALLNGSSKVKSLPDVQKSGSTSKVEVVIVPDGDKRSGNTGKTRSDQIYLSKSEAPKYKVDKKKRYAHPYYWSPFVLYGNWK